MERENMRVEDSGIGQTFPLIEVAGSSYEMGYQHGAQAADLVERYLVWIEKLTGMPRNLLCRNAMALVPFFKTLSPPLVEEIRGLADGAGISFEEAMLCQVRSEASRESRHGCTAFALTGSATVEHEPMAGQNQDLRPEYGDLALLLRVKPADGRPRALMLTFAGQLGYAGMNEYGLAQFANGLYDYQWRPGLSHYPLKRVMLEQRTVADCVELLTQNRACSAANVIVCDRQGAIADVEVRPEGIAVVNDEDPDCRTHTNHYLAPTFSDYETNSLADSRPRLARLRNLIRENWGMLTVETMKTILADHEDDPAGICRHGARDMYSIAGYIAEPAKGLFHVRRGHGCIGTWQTYEV